MKFSRDLATNLAASPELLLSVSRWMLPALLSGVLCSVFMTAHSQDQDARGAVLHPKPENLQVLPRDIAAVRLGRLMKQFESDLGVTCSYCHVENRDTGKLDYKSDDNPAKQTTRIMITMLDDINSTHLAKLEGDRRYATQVTCGSCHQGRKHPQTTNHESPGTGDLIR